MPVISLFYGIRITINWDDHNPPHIHVQYAEYKAIVAILEGNVMKGYLPGRQMKMVLAWVEIHRDELMQNWELCHEGLEPKWIQPL